MAITKPVVGQYRRWERHDGKWTNFSEGFFYRRLLIQTFHQKEAPGLPSSLLEEMKGVQDWHPFTGKEQECRQLENCLIKYDALDERPRDALFDALAQDKV
ncbi:MAG: hypothetical protein QF486_03940 [Candidatus Woesearchaeota archaeon]|jgi:hypothetical protein|nr:hypothetical protein [Candidatus Woesearchaeota archaeon]MDP7181659.1 hypothetical protein [Candidatus Woesearchaeota archaeon]MDP7198748.1 hypothetical protein [Candidatus Woesearchaeota archaeon]MDP7467252.1 hypothetical protein [Candidatus Woesearchaeota archaeon]MDP7647413.1 hypothetical protein [Candidatus Woesearchaeota archaeon]